MFEAQEIEIIYLDVKFWTKLRAENKTQYHLYQDSDSILLTNLKPLRSTCCFTVSIYTAGVKGESVKVKGQGDEQESKKNLY